MIKYLFTVITIISISLIAWFPKQEIILDLSGPPTVTAGESFEVTLIIRKGNLESFSRFIQVLPAGLSAERISAPNADFSFADQRLRIIWLKLPPQDEVRVTYRIKVHERLSGELILSGEFAYVEENQRRSLDVAGAGSVRILPNPEIPEDQVVDINDFSEDIKSELLAEQKDEPGISRSEITKTGNYEYTIELKVFKDDLNKFAKIEEYIPEGYRAIEGDSKGGIFSFSQGTAKILWMNLPEEKEFAVSYKIIPDPGYSIENLEVTGSFSYISGNQTESVAIRDELDPLVAITEPVDFPEVNIQEETEPEPERINQEKVPEKPEPVEAEEVRQKPQSTEGITYRVQIAAGHKPVNIDSYFGKRNISSEVRLEFHEGWRKYTTGPFDIYKEARDHRVQIWNTTPIKDAFVTAYNNGERITVQEALMIANQKWYR